MRPKGSLNRTTQETKRIINQMLDECLNSLKNDLKELKPSERIQTILQLFPYLIPKLRANETKLDLSKLEPSEIRTAINNLLDE